MAPGVEGVANQKLEVQLGLGIGPGYIPESTQADATVTSGAMDYYVSKNIAVGGRISAIDYKSWDMRDLDSKSAFGTAFYIGPDLMLRFFGKLESHSFRFHISAGVQNDSRVAVENGVRTSGDTNLFAGAAQLTAPIFHKHFYFELNVHANQRGAVLPTVGIGVGNW